MKNKGFTLIELLAVVAILALLGSIIIPIVNKDVSKSRQTLYNQQKKNIENAAKQYGAKYMGELPATNDDPPKIVTLSDLIKEGFIQDQVINPITKKAFKGSTNVVISYQNGKLIYTVNLEE